MKSIAVIGAGWAGLAAAIRLIEAGCAVTLFEAGRVAGGRARAVQIGDQTLDNGQHLLLGAYERCLSLMQTLGVDAEKVLERLPLHLEDDQGFRLALPAWPAPFHLAWGLLTARGVSLIEKWRTALWMEGLKKKHFQLAKPQQTVSEWLDESFQAGALRTHLWEPLCLAALNTPAQRASAQIFANVLRDSLGNPRTGATDLLLPRHDLSQVLPSPAIDWLTRQGATLHFSHRVKSLEPLPAATSGEKKIAVDGQPFDAAILAVAPQHQAALWPKEQPPLPQPAFEPIATIYLHYSPTTRLRHPIFSFPQRTTNESCDKWAVDRGNGLIALVISGQGAWCDLSDEVLVAECEKRLATHLDTNEKPKQVRIIREKRATFSCQPDCARPAAETALPTLFVAGDLSWADYPGTLEGAVRSGERAARLILADRRQ